MKCYRLSSLVLLAGLAAFAPAVYAKSKKLKAPLAVPKDEIEVVGHIPLTDGPVRRFLATQHYSSYYLYAEHDAGRTVTLIDVTKTSQPAVLADVSSPPDGGSDSLTLVAGTAALVTSEPAASPAPAATQTIRIMDFSDPQNPKAARVFAGVTAMSRDDGPRPDLCCQCRRHLDSAPASRPGPGSGKGILQLCVVWFEHVPT